MTHFFLVCAAQVQVDKGMKNNDKITFSREGDQHPDIKIPGDVVIVLQEKKHERFERRGPLAFDGILGIFFAAGHALACWDWRKFATGFIYIRVSRYFFFKKVPFDFQIEVAPNSGLFLLRLLSPRAGRVFDICKFNPILLGKKCGEPFACFIFLRCICSWHTR